MEENTEKKIISQEIQTSPEQNLEPKKEIPFKTEMCQLIYYDFSVK